MVNWIKKKLAERQEEKLRKQNIDRSVSIAKALHSLKALSTFRNQAFVSVVYVNDGAVLAKVLRFSTSKQYTFYMHDRMVMTISYSPSADMYVVNYKNEGMVPEFFEYMEKNFGF